MGTGADSLGNLLQVQFHGLGIAIGQHKAGRNAALGTDCAEDIGILETLILWCPWPGATPGPPSGDLVLLADPGFVLEPDL